jgi:membrane protein YdbS with pleckstrin-like domain
VPERVDTTDPEGVDYGWVMQTTFVLTIVVGAPIVAALSVVAGPLPTWGSRAGFAIRVGAVVWILTAVPVFLYARQRAARDGDTENDSDTDTGAG